MNCPPGKEVKVILYGTDGDLSFLKSQEPYFRLLAKVNGAEYLNAGDRPKGAATAVIGATEIYLPLEGMINVTEEEARLAKEVTKVEDELGRVQKKLSNGEFLKKAKEEIIQKERDKANQYEEKIRTLNRSLGRIRELKQGRS